MWETRQHLQWRQHHCITRVCTVRKLHTIHPLSPALTSQPTHSPHSIHLQLESLEKLRSDRLISATPKRVPIFVSGLIAQDWASFFNIPFFFFDFFYFYVLPLGKYEKGEIRPFVPPKTIICAARASDGFRQFP